LVNYIPNVENIAIPIVGMCIIFALMIAAYLEQKKDYSRKVFIMMLAACAVILMMEGVQWYLGKNISQDSGSGAMLITMFIFYSMLSVICGCWMIYSYFWFNGHAPSRKIIIWFIAGPACEIVALTANFFNGMIYSVGPGGYYARGEYFIIYIGASYAYLLAAIVITAIIAAKNNGKYKNREFSMFLFCFLFPVTGPVIQYVFPNIYVMGISEAIALLIVYVSVQQKTVSQYAADMARYRIEYGQYEDSLQALIAANPKALCTFHLNVTRNICMEGFGTSPYIISTVQSDTVDGLNDNISSIIEDDYDREIFSKHFSRDTLIKLFEDGETQSTAVYRRRMENGSFAWVRTTINLIRSPQTQEIEAVMYSENVNEEIIDEKIIQHITDIEYDYIGILRVDGLKFRLRYFGKNTLNRYRYSDDNVLNETEYAKIIDYALKTWIHPEEKEKFIKEAGIEKMKDNLRENDYFTVMVRCLTEDKKEGWKQIRYHWLDNSGQWILIEQMDVTKMVSEQQRNFQERLEVEQELRLEADKANESKSDFLSNVSHDMRTPLNAILGYDRLAANEKDTEVLQGYLSKIGQAGSTLLALINDTLDLQKIENGTTTLKPEIVGCGEVLEGIATAVQPMMDSKGINFIIDNSRACMADIRVDRIRVEEIFINLLSNAAKFTPEGGEVTLIVECIKLESDTVHDRLIVRDTGIGMSDEFQKKLFEPFAQERTEETAHIEGSGLGLTIAKRLVDMMKGCISVKSELGKGTEFTIELDFEKVENHEKQRKNEIPAGSLKDKRVLLCEDNAMNREIASAVLKMQGIEVTETVNGKQGLEEFTSSMPGQYDAVLMDIRMPVMNGYDAARAIRGSGHPDAKKIPIIALTADAYIDDADKANEAGMNDHLSKPLDPDKLYASLVKHCRK